MLKLGVLVVGALAASAPANAAVVFSENFDSYNGGLSRLNYSAFTTLDVVGKVDLVRSGQFGITCAGGTGSCVDLDGTPGAGALVTKSPISFNAGELFTVNFDLSGSRRSGKLDDFYINFDFGTGATIGSFGYNFDGTDVVIPINALTTGENFSFLLSGFVPMSARSFYFTSNSSGAVSVSFGTTSADRVGPVIDNIIATVTAVTAVPEPGTWSLMIAGFGLAGVLLRRRRDALVSFA